MDVPLLTTQFMQTVAGGRIAIYNEFSLQHELGIFLRGQIPEYRVQFERNVSYFALSKARFVKREIDITVFSPDKSKLATRKGVPWAGERVGGTSL